MGSVASKLKGPQYAMALLRRMEEMARSHTADGGEIQPEPFETLLEHSLRIPECRDSIIALLSRYVAGCLAGQPPDLDDF